tara:strand:- start:160 stop:363 length:204 start_codon:yes stop_codon:yes gene_type:complete
MTSKEYIVWLKGASMAIEESPTKEQWKKILKNLTEVKDDADINITIKEESKLNINKSFPGKPPEIYM